MTSYQRKMMKHQNATLARMNVDLVAQGLDPIPLMPIPALFWGFVRKVIAYTLLGGILFIGFALYTSFQHCKANPYACTATK